MNPQISYGEDLVTRIVAASKTPAEAAKLQSLLVEALNQLAADLCAETGLTTDNIVEAVVVGNTAIHHLLLKLPVRQLGLAPYIPATRAALDIKARVAMLLATRAAEAEKTTLAIDIGANTEICLNHHKGKMTSVSCASGPAFEGAHIKFGMRAAPGAIEHVRLENDRLEIQTIGAEAPIGVCGSGLLDVVAQLRLNGILDRSGRMGEHPRVRKETVAEFILAERPGQDPITISQKDVRELQLAKAAIRAGIQALTAAEGLTGNDIEQVIIAGAFGTFIDISSAITIGMLPNLPLERFSQVGNAAGTGAPGADEGVAGPHGGCAVHARHGFLLAIVRNVDQVGIALAAGIEIGAVDFGGKPAVVDADGHQQIFHFFGRNLLLRGEFATCGLCSRDLLTFLPEKSPGQISRLIKRLRVHGLIKKVAHRYKYYLTDLGRKAATLALKLREFQALPALASA